VLCYHGVCADEDAAAPWVPPTFVTASAFAAQLAMLRSYGPPVTIAEWLSAPPDASAGKRVGDHVRRRGGVRV